MSDFLDEFRRQTKDDPTWAAILIGSAIILGEFGLACLFLAWKLLL